jgi:hypothetical protein
MAKLTSKQRKKIPGKDFALPGRRYPIEDKAHARNALARVSQHGTASEKAAVRRKVAKKFPGIGKSGRTGKYTHGNKRSKKTTKRYGK